jgi:hypothetical protein
VSDSSDEIPIGAARADERLTSPGLRWFVRVFVLSAFALTVWLFGPRAVNVLAARFQQVSRNSPLVELDRVGFVARPDWMDTPLLLAVSTALAPWLFDEVPILDDGVLLRLRDGLQSVAWVRSASVERVFPDRLRLQVELRRPVLAVRDADGAPLCLVDRDAVVLPFVETPLPMTRLLREGGAPTMDVVVGRVAADARIRAAAAIVGEWSAEVAPLVAECPALLEVDATNLGERFARLPGLPEIRVVLRRGDGAGVGFAYDRPVDSPMVRVPAATKAAVLTSILGKHPHLDGLIAGDLRFRKRWADYLQPRASGVRDPFGPWQTPEAPTRR